MEKEDVRLSFNKFLKLYFDTCKEIYKEIGLDKITRKQFEYLNKIHKTENLTFSKFAEITSLSKPTVSEIINRFIEKGLAYKEQSLEDKRVSFIKLTNKGKVLATSNEIESSRVVEKIILKLDEEEVNKLTKLFDKIVD